RSANCRISRARAAPSSLRQAWPRGDMAAILLLVMPLLTLEADARGGGGAVGQLRGVIAANFRCALGLQTALHRRKPSSRDSNLSVHERPLSSEAASARAGSEGLQRRLPLLSRPAHRETEIEQPTHIIGIKIECCRGHRIIGLNSSKAKLPAVAARKVVSGNQSISRIRLDSRVERAGNDRERTIADDRKIW